MTGSFVFLTPDGAFSSLALLAPLAVLAVAAVRVARARAVLRLSAPPRRGGGVAFVGVVAVVGLLAAAAAQPTIVDRSTQRVRTDAEALFVLDISGSMQAASGPHAATRLDRARQAAARLRAAIPEVPSGVATLTDQLLPALLPVPDSAAFDATLDRSVQIEEPAPFENSVVATDFGQLAQVAEDGWFVPTARQRVVVLLTDGESNAYDVQAVANALERPPRTHVITVQFWKAGERIYDEPGGRPDPGYRPNPDGRVMLAELTAATGGRSFSDSDLGGAASALRADVGTGPTVQAGEASHDNALTPYVALAALLPLALLVRARAL